MVILILAASIIGFVAGRQTGQSSSSNQGSHVSSGSSSTPNLSDIVDYTKQNKVGIKIKDYKFTDQVIKVKKGTTVTWTNYDTVQHNAMREHEGDDTPHDPTAYGTGGFNGPLLSRGESWSYTFNEQVGTINYHCGPHPYMKGMVQIVE